MICTINKEEKSVNFIIEGDIDEKGAAELKDNFSNLNLSGLTNVSFDFGKVTYIGSAGLGKLLLFYKKLATVGTDMHINNANPEIKKLLKELNLDTLFKIS